METPWSSIRLLLPLLVVTACRQPEAVRHNGDVSMGSGGTAGLGGGDGGAAMTGVGGTGAADGGSVDDGGGPAMDSAIDGAFDVVDYLDASVARDAGVDGPPVMSTYLNPCARVHWTAIASHSNGGETPADAIDGKAVTRWTTGKSQSGNEVFEVDFGGDVSLTQIVLDNRSGNQNDYPRGYRVWASRDGVAFTSVLGPVAVPQSPGAALTINLPRTTGRAVRITQTGTAPLWWSVNEITFTCQPASMPAPGAIDPYDPANWKAMASASLGGAGESNAFDGNFGSRWTTGLQQRGTEVFQLDLGATTDVSEVMLEAPDDEFPARYSLELSSDNVSFVSAANGAGAQLTTATFTTLPARYIKIRQTGTAVRVWSISEIIVRP